MPDSDKMPPQSCDIIVKVPVKSAADRRRIASDVLALLHRAGIAAEVVLPDEAEDAPADTPS
jgi:hypothetical protein